MSISETLVASKDQHSQTDFRNQVSEREDQKSRSMRKWMSDYDLYDESADVDKSSGVYYGSANPAEPVSKVPCGGCGALLHCQDHSIPGYLPRELFSKRKETELKSMICQRCHFLKEFNVALDVSVTPDEYPRIISSIRNRQAIAVLMVDMLDFPCSIWPGIMDIIGTKRPVIVVGNKIDLIPGDHLGYLKHLKETLQTYVEKMGVGRGNIKHTALISARTGFGVEDLITELHRLWESRSDVFLLGCTNVGKSTLFNMLLQSDFCKTKAVDLVQRATTSVWPGTTLNLLKFPILRPEGWRLAQRRQRLLSETYRRRQEKAIRKQQFDLHRMYHMPSLLQYVGRTFVEKDEEDSVDLFSLKASEASTETIGIDDKDPDFAKGRWCYDTPGVMHPDQILDILTTEELVKVLPKTAIIPRFFILKPGRSLFLAGLGRIDLISSSTNESSRVAVFSSSELPVTIVPTNEADHVYSNLLGSELLAVPCGGARRLADWPGLQPKDNRIKLKGHGWQKCCADIVLSSAGWVSITGGQEMKMEFQAWTPLSRGIHLREPALLPFSVNFRGKRIDHTPTYETGRADGERNESDDFENIFE